MVSNSNTPLEDRQRLSELLATPGEQSFSKREEENHAAHMNRSEVSSASSLEKALGEQTTWFSSAPTHQEGRLQDFVSLGTGEGAMGFIGQMSEISWLQRVREYLVGAHQADFETSRSTITQHLAQTQDLNYFMDESNLLAIDEDYLEAGLLPSLDTAILLTEACFHCFHDGFWFMDRNAFLQNLSHVLRVRSVHSWAERRWLAMANVVWAIGAKWLQMAKLDRYVETHSTYYARARALGLDHRMLTGHPDIDSLEALGVLAFYLFVNGSISR
jgi:hypothetical protein